MSAAKATRMNISISDDVAGILERVGNKSGYLARLVDDAWRDWQEALAALSSAGWRGADVRVACDVINRKVWSVGEATGRLVEFFLSPAHGFEAIASKHGVSNAHWNDLLNDLKQSQWLGFAVVTVVREYWRGNAELERAIDRLDQVAEIRARDAAAD